MSFDRSVKVQFVVVQLTSMVCIMVAIINLDIKLNVFHQAMNHLRLIQQLLDTITACDSLVWYGTTYRTQVAFSHTLQAANGCDSIVTLNLTINNSTTGDTTAIAMYSLVAYN